MFKSSLLRSLALASFLCLTQIAFAQSKVTVNGTVKDANGEPIAGVSIIEKGTVNGTATDLEGNYKLTVPANATISADCIGYASFEFKAGSNGTQNIVLEEDALNLDDVVVVGYSTTTRRDLISSVSQVKTKEIGNLPVTNLSQGLAGRSPGLIVVQSGGGVNVTPQISIRGGGDPLYVIDGVIRNKTDFVNLSSEDIESISILKDASATAVYGSRASNGIIQVVTKNGTKESGLNVDYDFNYSLSQVANWPERMGSYDMAYWTNVGRENDGLSPTYDENAMNAILNGTDLYNYGDWNHRKEVLRPWAPQKKHNVRISGGNDVNHFFASLGNTYQQSLYKTGTHWMDRTNFRLSDVALIKPLNLQITFSIDGYRQTTNHPATLTGNSYFGVFSHLNNHSPLQPYYNKYGNILSGGDNAAAETSADGGYNRDVQNVLNGRGELLWTCPWVTGLKLRVSSDWRYYGNNSKQWVKEPTRYDWDSTSPVADKPENLTLNNGTGLAYTNQAFVDYSNTFGKHTVSALAGFEQYYERTSSFWAKRDQYQFPIDQINVGNANYQTNGGSESEYGRAAWIGQLRYNYANKYYIEGSMRYDGSDYFAPGHRWGLFFSGSAGWIVTAEKFMQSLKDKHIIDMLKLRVSYGETGLDSSAGRFAYLSTYNMNSQGYVVNGGFVPTFSEGSLPSPDLTWYTTRQTDAGFDFSSANNRLYGSFDYFYYSTKGYLVTPTGQSYLNTAFGQSMPKVKSDSEFRREGVEIQLGWRDTVGDFSYDIAGNITFFDQLWAYDQSESESSYMNPYTRTQQNKGYYGTLYHALGYYKNADDVLNSAGIISAVNSTYLSAGDIKYEDTNGDGQITGADVRRLGKNSFPRSQFGILINLGYKGFYFSANFQGATKFNMMSPNNMMVYYDYQTDAWTPSNTSAQYPRLTSNYSLNANNNTQSSDFWLINGAYLRMKDFQFGYDFKYSVLKDQKWISRAKLGITGQNIFTISESLKYGLDPENGSNMNYAYPVERILALYLNIGF